MEKINAWIILSDNFLDNRLLMRYSLVLFLLRFDSLASFISELSSLDYSSSLFLCSLARFITQTSVSLGESL